MRSPSPSPSKERFLNACWKKEVDRPPVWMMRQAGRYLPEYREIRRKKTTLEMMKDPETACEITLQPVTRLGVDAAILYSDILIVPEAMGLGLSFVQDVGPVFSNPVRSAQDVERLEEKFVPDRAAFVEDAIRLLRKNLDTSPSLGGVPLIGFAGAPFTVASYMVSGEGANEGNSLKQMAWNDETAFRRLMEKIVIATTDYLAAQINAGVDAVQLFDTWAGTLSAKDYRSLAFPYVKEIFSSLRNRKGADKTPFLLYIKGGGALFDEMVETGANVISIDWRLPLAEAKRRSQGRVAIQGNLDPAILYAPIPKIEEAVNSMKHEWGPEPGYIINLGHGMMPDIPVEHAQAFVDAAKRE